MAYTPADLRSELESHVRFETMLVELSLQFLRIPADEVDGAITQAQQRVCEALGVDVSALWQWSGDGESDVTLTHLHRPMGGPPFPQGMNAAEDFPWFLERISAGRPVVAPSPEDFPPEGARDRETLRRLGIISSVALPLAVGGAPPFGAISFNTMRERRDWPGEVLRRLDLVAQIFANALSRKRSDRALKESEERLSLAAESGELGLWSLDLAGGRLWATPKSRELFGLPADTSLTLDGVLELIHRDDRDSVLRTIDEVVRSRQVGRLEYRVRRPDGHEAWIVSRGRVRCDPAGKPAILMGVSVDVSERHRAEEISRNLGGRILAAHEEERSRLARELHDDVSQRLACFAIDVARIESQVTTASTGKALRDLRTALARLGEDIHALSHQLHPSILVDLGLVAALTAECERFALQQSIPVETELGEVPDSLSRATGLCLFRVTQEALRNVARHARAGGVRVSLRERDGGLEVRVGDDGVGFDASAPPRTARLGLVGMRERVLLLHGRVEVASAPGRGTSVAAWIPIPGERP
ncbi:MAG TPA: PAS domain-containing protein [Candidatus Polarisedimenticolaceae bacterium]